MNEIKPRENSISEVEAIYKIVLRNLQPHNYAQLFPEAQPVILQEAKTLLLCSALSNQKKGFSLNHWSHLRSKIIQFH